jgi:hypothetical protein
VALVELCRCDNAFEAGIVRGRLEAEDIRIFLFDLETNRLDGMLQPLRLMIHEEDVDAARRILSEMAAEGGVIWDRPTGR